MITNNQVHFFNNMPYQAVVNAHYVHLGSKFQMLHDSSSFHIPLHLYPSSLPRQLLPFTIEGTIFGRIHQVTWCKLDPDLVAQWVVHWIYLLVNKAYNVCHDHLSSMPLSMHDRSVVCLYRFASNNVRKLVTTLDYLYCWQRSADAIVTVWWSKELWETEDIIWTQDVSKSIHMMQWNWQLLANYGCAIICISAKKRPWPQLPICLVSPFLIVPMTHRCAAEDAIDGELKRL